MSIVVIAEHDNLHLKPATANTVTAARQIAEKTGLDIYLFVAGSACHSVAEQAGKLKGVKKVILADSDVLASQLAENVTQVLVNLVQSQAVGYLLAPATTQGKNLLPRVAALLDVAQVSDMISVVSEDTFVRPIYAGNALATVQSSDPVKVITVRTSAFELTEDDASIAEIEPITVAEDTGLSQFISEQVSESERPELTSARIIISGGRGMQNGDNFSLLEKVADKIGAAVGASRAAVDSGFVPNDMQVGQTGKIVAPDLYIAVGISGAIQHLAGMKDSKVIVAINKDEEAPIFSVADYGLQADLFEALPELASKL